MLDYNGRSLQFLDSQNILHSFSPSSIHIPIYPSNQYCLHTLQESGAPLGIGEIMMKLCEFLFNQSEYCIKSDEC